MPGCYIHVWLFLFLRVTEGKEETILKRGLYSRVEIIGEKLDQNITDSLRVEWIKINRSSKCVCLIKNNNNTTNYIPCCGKAHFYLNNNTLILENMTARDEGVYMEKIITGHGTTNHQNFTLIIGYPPNVTELVVSRTSNNVTLRCEVIGSFQHLMWKREGVVIREEHNSSSSENNQTLQISSSDSGIYSCTASNQYGQSERHINIIGITGENSTVPLNQENGKTQSGQTVLLSGLAFLGVLGLCVVFYCLYKHHHRKQAENSRTTDEGDADYQLGIYQEITELTDAEVVAPLPYVYSDFIKPKDSEQASAAAQQCEDFGYSEVGPTATCRVETAALYCDSDEQSVECPDTGEE